MRKSKEITEYMNEACDMVWLVRHFNLLATGRLENAPADIVDEAKRQADRICIEHMIEDGDEISDWEYGYWSGILAALRWVQGEEKDMLDT